MEDSLYFYPPPHVDINLLLIFVLLNVSHKPLDVLPAVLRKKNNTKKSVINIAGRWKGNV
jgi:hypothetical protein